MRGAVAATPRDAVRPPAPSPRNHSERVQRLLARVGEIARVDAGPEANAGAHRRQRNAGGALVVHPDSGDEVIASLDAGELLEQALGPAKIVDQGEVLRRVGAE